MRYTPFEKDIENVDPPELKSLTSVYEGWYVEYKSQAPTARVLAKSLASFANQFGGWVFLGVDEDSPSGSAGAFPGILNEDVPQVLESIRNAAKDLIRPVVEYRERVFPGPIKEIELDSSRSLIAFYVPEGPTTPYVHNDGRIYIRVGDSSSPVFARDRATFDMLFRRGENKRRLLESQTDKIPEISEEERNTPYLHLAILSDPYENLGHWYAGSFSEFSELMGRDLLRFDNVFTTQNGYVARQVLGNNRYLRMLTWEFLRKGHSFVTLPIPLLSPASLGNTIDVAGKDNPTLGYSVDVSVGKAFLEIVAQKGLAGCTILDLTHAANFILAIFKRHRTIMRHAGVNAPLYVKSRIENVWRTIPYVNLPVYLEHVRKYDIPLVQWDGFELPPRSSSSPCILFPERDDVPEETEPDTEQGPVNLWLGVMEALGVPMDFLAQNASELVRVSSELMKSQVARGRDA